MTSVEDAESGKAIFSSTESFPFERVFPIRHLEDAEDHEEDSEITPKELDQGIDYLNLDPPKASEEYEHQPWPPFPPNESIRRLPPSSLSEPDGTAEKFRISGRSQMIPEKNGKAPGIMPGVVTSAQKPTFHKCEDEPIRIPGAIQSYGALVAFKNDAQSNLVVRIASENSRQLLGRDPQGLFSLKSFCELLDDATVYNFRARVDYVLETGHDPLGNTDLDVFTLSLKALNFGDRLPLWCAMHLAEKSEDLVICEFEAQDEDFFPGMPGRQTFPKNPTRTLENEDVPGERLKSTTRRSRPLRVLQIARRQHHQIGYMESFNALSQVQQQLTATRTLQDLLDVLVGLVQEMTHFHRVMVYRFDRQKNGSIEAEIVDPRASEDLFRGLHFPASDIPAQARELYKINMIRSLYDRDAETARLVCRDDSDFAQPLDLTHSYLRAMSPIHLKYLANMGVRSSMSISLIVNDDLWGLVACHSYGKEGIRVPLPIRELCRIMGSSASANIERLLMLKRLGNRRSPDLNPTRKSPSEVIAASSTDLLRIFDADFGLLSIQDEVRPIGKLDPYQEALVLMTYVRKLHITEVFASQSISTDFPNIAYKPGILSIAGMLIIPLTLSGSDFIVFFRKGQLEEVRWAGNPYEKILSHGTTPYLEPRSSFRQWTEKIRGMSREWSYDQIETAGILNLLYGRFIEVWRQKELAVQKSRLTQLLLKNSSHEVRTPLNAIINYVELALENPVDDNTREALSKAHIASRSLVYVIDDLLKLTRAEDGHVTAPGEAFNLDATVHEVIETYQKEAARRGLDLTASSHPGIPLMVKGEAARLRQVLSNITSNAFQNSSHGGIKVDIRPIRVEQRTCIIGITIQDTGSGMSEAQVDKLFQEFEQIVDTDTAIGGGEKLPINTGDKEALGLGLAVVARYVKNMKGQIKLQSELGKGTIFTIELPFNYADATPTDGEKLIPSLANTRPSPSVFTPGSEAPPSSYISEFSSVNESPLASPSNTEAVPNPSQIDFATQRPLSSPHAAGIPLRTISTLNATFDATFDVTSPDNKGSILATSGISGLGRRSNEATTYPFPDMSSHEPKKMLSILIAEDNPVNARVLKRRLEKAGHSVVVAVDGQACHDVYFADPGGFDVILMDLQMPLVDGPTSTKMIRRLERALAESQPGQKRQRVPVFAVSASLAEEQRFDYVESGFDAWVLKPIDYSRLEVLMGGIHIVEARRDGLFVAGAFERGGWFLHC